MYDETGDVEEGWVRLGTEEYLNLWYLGPTVRLKNQRRRGLNACSYITTARQCKARHKAQPKEIKKP